MADEFGVEGVREPGAGSEEQGAGRGRGEMTDDRGQRGERREGGEILCKQCETNPAMLRPKSGKPSNGLCRECWLAKVRSTREKKVEGGRLKVDSAMSISEARAFLGGLPEVPAAVNMATLDPGDLVVVKRHGPGPISTLMPPERDVDALVAEAAELVDEHWRYIEGLLMAHGQPVEPVQYHYRTAFLHGFKHGVEAAGGRGQRADDR